MKTENRRRRIAEARAEMLETIRPKAERELNDERFDRLRSRPARQVLVAVWIAGVAWVTVAAWFDQALTLVAGMIVLFGAGLLLRRVVRGMADLPEELLDERMRERRNRAYRLAYTGLAAVTLLPVVALWMAADASRIDLVLEARHLQALLWLVLGTALALPSAVLAVTEDEV